MSKNPYIIKGRHSIEEAFEAGKPLQKVYIKKGRSERDGRLISRLREMQVPISEIPPQAFRKLGADAADGMVAETAPVEYFRSGEVVQRLFEEGKTPRLVVLDGITDVRNFGAIARSALGFGFHALVIPGHETALVTADSLKTSAGALHHIPVCREMHFIKAVEELALLGITLTACTEKAGKLLQDTDLTGPCALILGSEEKGISKEVRTLCHHEARIPMTGPVGSLNVSVAAGVSFYEVVRQSR